MHPRDYDSFQRTMPNTPRPPPPAPADFAENDAPTRNTKRPMGFDEDPVTDPGSSFDEVAPFGRSAAGRPLDRAGTEWDVVSRDGHGFNDHDGPAQMRLPGSPNALKDDWGPWSDRDLDSFFQRHVDIEKARTQGTEAFATALARHGLRTTEHWDRVCFTYFRHHGPRDARFVRLVQQFDPV